MTAPGSYVDGRDRTGRFERLAARLPKGALVVLDARVKALHPSLVPALRRREPLAIHLVRAGESAKSLASLGRLCAAGRGLKRGGMLLAIGGGTVGDLSTVAAHLLRRGVVLWQVPTTLLAAVDSSVGGKGALNLEGTKNALGVFHSAAEHWLCPELWETLPKSRRAEGRIEAWKMALTLSPKHFARWASAPPSDVELVRAARALKRSVCRRDPYERTGLRAVLNFGHTFGHVLESVTHFRVPHGAAVGLGTWCALDVGVALGVTPRALAAELEHVLLKRAAFPPRKRLAQHLARATPAQLAELLGADKKSTRGLNMVLLKRVGQAVVRPVPPATWRQLLPAWRAGRVP